MQVNYQSNQPSQSKFEVNTILGFDFGMRYIGVAVAHTISMSTQACRSLLAQKGEPLWSEVAQLINTWQPAALIVGIPVHLNGKEHIITTAARAFLNKLTDRFPLPVYGAEERLTSVEARARLFEQGGYKSLSKQAIDGLSACLIVEGWLNEHRLSQTKEIIS